MQLLPAQLAGDEVQSQAVCAFSIRLLHLHKIVHLRPPGRPDFKDYCDDCPRSRSRQP